ncbi:hypothetical protein HDU97_002899 [Phlyctochytrium planicorne]|nr:hypothetical protein HDU97_002899 [Phlyctochytrium planicorne]
MLFRWCENDKEFHLHPNSEEILKPVMKFEPDQMCIIVRDDIIMMIPRSGRRSKVFIFKSTLDETGIVHGATMEVATHGTPIYFDDATMVMDYTMSRTVPVGDFDLTVKHFAEAEGSTVGKLRQEKDILMGSHLVAIDASLGSVRLLDFRLAGNHQGWQTLRPELPLNAVKDALVCYKYGMGDPCWDRFFVSTEGFERFVVVNPSQKSCTSYCIDGIKDLGDGEFAVVLYEEFVETVVGFGRWEERVACRKREYTNNVSKQTKEHEKEKN